MPTMSRNTHNKKNEYEQEHFWNSCKYAFPCTSLVFTHCIGRCKSYIFQVQVIYFSSDENHVNSFVIRLW
uniref:Uncharacterized protein n=1 Tax=Arundo donax TaxID=35708 RepID=A0A0A9G002_ARUDO